MENYDFISDSIDLDFDFDLGDFDLIGESQPIHEPTHQRILKPRVNLKSIDTRMVSYENAKVFVRELDLSENARTYAWLDGSFIFGEIIEALGDIGRPVRKAWIT